jgi:hypothetical protein
MNSNASPDSRRALIPRVQNVDVRLETTVELLLVALTARPPCDFGESKRGAGRS